jgi:hypothetical protein
MLVALRFPLDVYSLIPYNNNVFTYHHYLKAMWPTQRFFESQVMILAGYQFPHGAVA